MTKAMMAMMAMMAIIHRGALVLLLAGFVFPPAAAQDHGLFVPGPGADETYTYCIGCHSEKLIVQQGLDRNNWEDVLNWMVEEQDMEPLDEPERSLILDYLARHYNVDRPNFPKR